MEKILDQKIVLVTGCSRGIGKAIACLFAKEGAIVYANARKECCLDEFASDLKRSGFSLIPVYYDVTDEQAVKQAFMRIKKEQGHLDVLVNNAGVMKDALIGMISSSLMDEVFKTNVYSVINHLQLASRLMKSNKCGNIINIASIIGTNGNAGQTVYSASKGAVVSITKTAAKELGPSGIRVNAIAPGIIDTDLTKAVDSEKLSERISGVKLGHIGSPDDVANTALFLASDYSAYISGQIIGVDGCAIV